jgi:hypothetical protein
MEGGHNICKCVWGLTIKKSNQQHRGLRASRDRPRGRAAEQRDELASSYVEHGLPSGTRWGSLLQAQDAPEAPAGPVDLNRSVLGGRNFSVDFAELFRRSYKPVLKVCKFGSSNSPRTLPANESRRSAA